HQHETVLGIAGEYLRRMQTGVAQARTDVEPWRDVFLRGRRVHDDPAAVAFTDAPVAAKARIGRRDLDGQAAGKVVLREFQAVTAAVGSHRRFPGAVAG